MNGDRQRPQETYRYLLASQSLCQSPSVSHSSIGLHWYHIDAAGLHFILQSVQVSQFQFMTVSASLEQSLLVESSLVSQKLHRLQLVSALSTSVTSPPPFYSTPLALPLPNPLPLTPPTPSLSCGILLLLFTALCEFGMAHYADESATISTHICTVGWGFSVGIWFGSVFAMAWREFIIPTCSAQTLLYYRCVRSCGCRVNLLSLPPSLSLSLPPFFPPSLPFSLSLP